MHLYEGTFRDALGATVVRSQLGPGTERQGFERQFFPGVEVGLPGWQRAHSQGAGTGRESPTAIRYAPEEVNQALQRLGIEGLLREMVRAKPPQVTLWLTTVTATHPRSLRLKEIQYRVDAVRDGVSRRLFECSIEIGDSKVNPRVSLQATPLMPFG